MLETSITTISLLILVIGAVIAVLLTRKMGLWLDAIRETELVANLRKDNSAKSREIHLLKEQNSELKKANAILEAEVSELRIAVRELTKNNNLLHEKISARNKLIEENQRVIRTLSRKMEEMEISQEDFRESVTEFLESVLGDKAKGWKEFLNQKAK